jgi:hypothetical protein
MKEPRHSSSLPIRLLVLSLVIGATSCSVPPKEAWQKMRREGVLKALFSPQRSEAQLASHQQTSGRQNFGSAQLHGSGGSIQLSPSARHSMPRAESIQGRPGFVYSPFTTPKKLVNVQGFAAGEQVLCPYTLESFIVPGSGANPMNVPSIAAADAAASLPETTKPRPRPRPVQVASRDNGQSFLSTPEPSDSGMPFGSWVESRPGFVYSPFAAKHQLVDVTGIAPGVEVRCPYSGRNFRVPELPNAGATEDQPRETKPKAKPEAPAETKSMPTPMPEPTPEPQENLVSAKWVAGQPGLVQSPWGEEGQYVDVTGKSAGARVLCPFTGKPFQVPAK